MKNELLGNSSFVAQLSDNVAVVMHAQQFQHLRQALLGLPQGSPPLDSYLHELLTEMTIAPQRA